jgi:hypothetical protein
MGSGAKKALAQNQALSNCIECRRLDPVSIGFTSKITNSQMSGLGLTIYIGARKMATQAHVNSSFPFSFKSMAV